MSNILASHCTAKEFTVHVRTSRRTLWLLGPWEETRVWRWNRLINAVWEDQTHALVHCNPVNQRSVQFYCRQMGSAIEVPIYLGARIPRRSGHRAHMRHSAQHMFSTATDWLESEGQPAPNAGAGVTQRSGMSDWRTVTNLLKPEFHYTDFPVREVGVIEFGLKGTSRVCCRRHGEVGIVEYGLYRPGAADTGKRRWAHRPARWSVWSVQH